VLIRIFLCLFLTFKPTQQSTDLQLVTFYCHTLYLWRNWQQVNSEYLSCCSVHNIVFPFVCHHVLCTCKIWSFLIAVLMVVTPPILCVFVYIYIANCTASHSDIVYSSYANHHENISYHFITYLWLKIIDWERLNLKIVVSFISATFL
jgi:hypothetical protein